MTSRQVRSGQKEAGFTLVELAVVMIIIGLLIGGVLKGQELIANAQITATASAVKGIDAATTTFRDTYAGMPGDLVNANNRLANCTTASGCAIASGTAGLGNGRVDGAFNAAATAEMIAFWRQLSAGDLITGIDPNRGNAWGGNFPSAPVNGGFYAAYDASGSLGSNTSARAGHYLILHNNPTGGPDGTTLTATQAARIDRKMDDGVPNTGTIFTRDGTTACNNNGVYAESTAAATCDLFVRFQN